MFDDIKDSIIDAWEYIISFEWFGDIGDFFGGLFTDMDDFSVTGLFFGIITFAMIFLLRNQMLNPFLEHMSSGGALFWGGITYFAALVGGYLVGKRLFDN